MAEGGFRHPNSGALIGGGFRRWWGRGWGQRTHSVCGQHTAARGSLAAEATGAGGSDLVTGGAGCVGAGMYRSFGFEDDRPVMVCPPPQILATAFHRRLTQTDAWLRQTLGRARPCHTAFSRRSLCRQGAAGAGRFDWFKEEAGLGSILEEATASRVAATAVAALLSDGGALLDRCPCQQTTQPPVGGLHAGAGRCSRCGVGPAQAQATLLCGAGDAALRRRRRCSLRLPAMRGGLRLVASKRRRIRLRHGLRYWKLVAR